MGLCTSTAKSEDPGAELTLKACKDVVDPSSPDTGIQPPQQQQQQQQRRHCSHRCGGVRRSRQRDPPQLSSQPPSQHPLPPLLTPLELLHLAGEVVASGTLPKASAADSNLKQEGIFAHIVQPAQLAAVAIVGTQGNASASPCGQGELCPVGLCLVRPAAAQHLVACQGYTAYGSRPSRQQLMDPRASMYFCAAQLQELQAQLREGEQEVSCGRAPSSPNPEEHSQEEMAVRIFFGYPATPVAAAPAAGSDSGIQHSNSEQISEDPCPLSHAWGVTQAHSPPSPAELLPQSAQSTQSEQPAQSAHAQKQVLTPLCCNHAKQQQQQQGVGLGSAVFEESLWPRYCCARDQLRRLEAALLASRKVERRSHQMYVVREGETADTICAALSLPVEALEAANPDVPVRCADGGLQCNDCIVLPVSVCLPRCGLLVVRVLDTCKWRLVWISELWLAMQRLHRAACFCLLAQVRALCERVKRFTRVYFL
ncbi:hypothetical protein DUNSADRAFT_3050 [Dunaliella salina]|uniref:LysM domain-containing protein n=1 Tax=Dunaliella salina TaxID=3046 RepID=A0ABQ7GUQ7_DUNSA|nr:hypothetical protein DUNSADRAFT_3050 [Dunaliella salina]|eukprot:KAF5838318.1 hypothetical protein DUNSADRAFT_3050 [Dunaliella salina]